MLLDMLNLGMSPASLAVFGSNEPFNQWQLHSGELIALLTAKDLNDSFASRMMLRGVKCCHAN